jgi:uncharacterized protein (DUF1800 family)
MARDPKFEAALALHRFGLGPREGSIAAIAGDARGALIEEMDRADAGRIVDAALPSSAASGRAVFAFRKEQLAMRQAERAARDTAQQGSMPPESKSSEPASGLAKSNPGPALPQRIYLDEARARMHAALQPSIGFPERLVWFWSNHFCVSADKGNVRGTCGAFEREAIRTHVLGRFHDMLLAVESHPAMLVYLDNVRSIGPDSIAGVRQKRGLNENLAREILELHTLGVRSAYSQEDVTNFAKVLTGWTIVPLRQEAARAGEFEFNMRMHQPGPQRVIGKTYADTGIGQGRAVLSDLARHPATARHIATKLARHFVADEPPAGLVENLARRFLDSDGDLKQVAKALVHAPEAWDESRRKLKRPGEWLVGAVRAAGAVAPEIAPVMQAHNLLGEPLWRPPAPKGFSDESGVWLDGLAQRLDIANQFARRFPPEAEPRHLFEQTLAPLASAETREAIARAESRPQALALLLMAPEFQRR